MVLSVWHDIVRQEVGKDVGHIAQDFVEDPTPAALPTCADAAGLHSTFMSCKAPLAVSW